MLHRLALLLAVVGIAIIIIGLLVGLKEAAVYVFDKITAIASKPSPPPPKVVNVYVNRSPGEPSKGKGKSRSRTRTEQPAEVTQVPTSIQGQNIPQPPPIQQPVQEVVWQQPATNSLSDNRFEITLPVHIAEFDTHIWADASKIVTVKFDSGSRQGYLRYLLNNNQIPIGETKPSDSYGQWTDTIKIINREPRQNAAAKPYVLLITIEEGKPQYTHNDCIKLVATANGNVSKIPADCMSEWQDYQAEVENKQQREEAAQRRRDEDLERERLRKQQQRDRTIQQGITTLERIIRRH